ncbi:MAG: hypothetical protein RR357_05980 [Clostridia bacterium]
MFYLYLNNDKLRAMFATATGKKVTVQSVYDMDFPSEFLNDPTQTNIDLQLTEAILDLIRKNDIKSKSVNFVLENSKIPFREMFLPYAKPTVLMPIIQGELFTDKKLADAHTVDYIEIERNANEEKQSRLLITYIDNLIIANLKKCCRDVGMKLEKIDIAQSALSKLVSYLQLSLPQSFMLVDYRLTTVTSYMFANGKHIFSLTKPIYSLPNENYANEMAFFVNDFGSIVNESIQFFKAKYEQYPFETVFITGDTVKYAPCEKQLADYLGIDIRILPLPENIKGVDVNQFNEVSAMIGSLVKAR